MSDRSLRVGVFAVMTAVLIVLWFMGGRAARAAEPDAVAVAEAAAEANVAETDLLGALFTVGQDDPRTYLHHTYELRRPEPVLVTATYSVWDRLAICESGGRWNINTGNGYFGGVQMDMTFWRRYGGLAFAARPDLATRTQQIVVAERGLAVQGWAAWPACSRRLGLR